MSPFHAARHGARRVPHADMLFTTGEIFIDFANENEYRYWSRRLLPPDADYADLYFRPPSLIFSASGRRAYGGACLPLYIAFHQDDITTIDFCSKARMSALLASTYISTRVDL